MTNQNNLIYYIELKQAYAIIGGFLWKKST